MLSGDSAQLLLLYAQFPQAACRLVCSTQFLLLKGCCPDLCLWTMMLAERYSLQDTLQAAVSHQCCANMLE